MDIPIVDKDVRKNDSGDVLDFVLRNAGIVDEILLAAQAGCSLRFDMKFLRCSCGRADGLILLALPPFVKTENAGAYQTDGLMGVCILLFCMISVERACQ